MAVRLGADGQGRTKAKPESNKELNLQLSPVASPSSRGSDIEAGQRRQEAAAESRRRRRIWQEAAAESRRRRIQERTRETEERDAEERAKAIRRRTEAEQEAEKRRKRENQAEQQRKFEAEEVEKKAAICLRKREQEHEKRSKQREQAFPTLLSYEEVQRRRDEDREWLEEKLRRDKEERHRQKEEDRERGERVKAEKRKEERMQSKAKGGLARGEGERADARDGGRNKKGAVLADELFEDDATPSSSSHPSKLAAAAKVRFEKKTSVRRFAGKNATATKRKEQRTRLQGASSHAHSVNLKVSSSRSPGVDSEGGIFDGLGGLFGGDGNSMGDEREERSSDVDDDGGIFDGLSDLFGGTKLEPQGPQVADELPRGLGGGAVPTLFWEPLNPIVGGESAECFAAEELDVKPSHRDLQPEISGSRWFRRPGKPPIAEPPPLSPPAPMRFLGTPGAAAPTPVSDPFTIYTISPAVHPEPDRGRQPRIYPEPDPQRQPHQSPEDPAPVPPLRDPSLLPAPPLRDPSPVRPAPPLKDPSPVQDLFAPKRPKRRSRPRPKPLKPITSSLAHSFGPLGQRIEFREPSPKAESTWTPSDASDMEADPHLWLESREAMDWPEPQVELPPTRIGFSFAPAVAMRMIPNYEAELHDRTPPELDPSLPKAAWHGDAQVVEENAHVYVSEVPTYQQFLDHARRSAPPPVPNVSLAMNYQKIAVSRCGPMVLEPFASVPVRQFEKNMVAVSGDYTNLARGVNIVTQRPVHGPDSPQIQSFDVIPFDRSGRFDGDDAKDKLIRAFEENKEFTQRIARDALRMGSAMAPMQSDLAIKPVLGDPTDAINTDKYGAPSPDLFGISERLYHKVKLDILIIRATNIPEAEGLFHCDPYVVVTVVDGNPCTDEALAGGVEWYAKHEQFHGLTPVLESTTDPEWRHRLYADVRPRENSFVHFRVYDHDAVAKEDRGIGHAAIKLSEVQKNLFHGPRPIALAPFQKGSAKAWAGLKHSRLFFSVGWEEAAARLKHTIPGHKETHSTTVSRARKRGLKPTSPDARRRPAEESRTTANESASRGLSDEDVDEVHAVALRAELSSSAGVLDGVWAALGYGDDDKSETEEASTVDKTKVKGRQRRHARPLMRVAYKTDGARRPSLVSQPTPWTLTHPMEESGNAPRGVSEAITLTDPMDQSDKKILRTDTPATSANLPKSF